MNNIIKRYVSLIKRIPERHYWPLFIFLSSYFVVPYSEFVVTAFILLYFKFERLFRKFGEGLSHVLPEWFRLGGSIIFFLVMIDDTLFYVALIAVGLWSSRMVSKESGTPPSQEVDGVLQLQGKQKNS